MHATLIFAQPAREHHFLPYYLLIYDRFWRKLCRIDCSRQLNWFRNEQQCTTMAGTISLVNSTIKDVVRRGGRDIQVTYLDSLCAAKAIS
jgi:hypothetical protein